MRCFPPKERSKYRVQSEVHKIGYNAFAWCTIDSLYISPKVDFWKTGTNASYYDPSFTGFKGNIVIERSFGDYKFLEGIDASSTVTVIGSDVEKASKYCNHVKTFPYWGKIKEVGPEHIAFEVKQSGVGTSASLGKVLIGDREMTPDADGLYAVSNLKPETDYRINICYNENGSTKIFPLDFTTPKPTIGYNFEKSHMGMMEFYLDLNENLPADKCEYGVIISTFYDNIERGKYKADENGYVCADNLFPGREYKVKTYVCLNGEYYFEERNGLLRTERYDIKGDVKYKIWQDAIMIESFDLPDDETFYPDYVEVGYMAGDIMEPINITELPYTWCIPWIKPGERMGMVCRWVKGSEYGYGSFSTSFITKSLDVTFNKKDIGPTSATIGLKYIDSSLYSGKEKDYMYTVTEIKLKNGTPLDRWDCIELTGLEPNSDNKLELKITAVSRNNAKTYTEDVEYSFKTKKLELTTEQPRMPSEGSAIASARTNVNDKDTGVGFQWRKYDAPSTVAPNEGYAAVYDGVAEGYIRNLQSDHYYNLRAFYKSAAGKYYYSDWLTFDPSDFSYFEPIVHTYPVEYTTATTTDVRGYVMPGSDAVTEQGFEYWPAFSPDRRQRMMLPAPADAEVVFSSGQVMTARLQGLEPGQQYEVRSFVTAAGSTYYGETQSFATEELSGIGNVTGETPVEPVAYFDMSGRRFAAPQQGLNIVVYSDGTIEKIYFR